MSLISAGKIDDERYPTLFGKGGWKIVKGSLVVAKGQEIDTLYTLRSNLGIVDIAKEDSATYLWHRRLRHMTKRCLKILANKNFFLR